MIPAKSIEVMKPFHTETGEVNAIIETPKGSGNKYKYDSESGLFLLDKVFHAGFVFPYDFGFAPSTLGEDGDPIDILTITDVPVFPGCLIRTRLIGAIQAQQTQKGETYRNDRLIGVASVCDALDEVRELTDLVEERIAQIERFFVHYNESQGKEFKLLGRVNASDATRLLQAGADRFQKQ